MTDPAVTGKIATVVTPFENLSAPEQRVAIARDVLALLAAQKIAANQGAYLKLPRKVIPNSWHINANDLLVAPAEAEVRDVIAAQTAPCTVCAVGACFVAGVLRHDSLTVGTFGNDENDRDGMEAYLGRWFEPEQLRLIETAFEMEERFYQGEGEDYEAGDEIPEIATRAVMFGEDNSGGFDDDSDTARLIAIMQNVINNGGTFRP